MPTRRRAFTILLLLSALALLSMAWSLATGSIFIALPDIVVALWDNTHSPVADILWTLRLPRVLSGFACGGLLALAGALLQVLLRNPLADPYVMGISGGAGVGAILAILFGLGASFISGLAFLGALTVMFIVFALAHGDGSWTQSRLLLTGIIIASGCGATVTLLLSIAPDQQMRSMLFWLMGDLSQATHPLSTLFLLLILLVISLRFARELNILTRGVDMAQALGVAVKRLRYGVYIVASLATAMAVTEAGSIGFIGLIVPHLVRLSVGNDQRLLLPSSVLAGGSLLLIADTLARTVIAPQQLPVGVLTALIGVPAFLFLLTRDGRAR